MPRVQRDVSRAGSTDRMSARMCLGCGYDGWEMQADGEAAVYVCPRCDADLYERPPRSYAEMEGLDAGAGTRWARCGGVLLPAGPTPQPTRNRRAVAMGRLAAACVGALGAVGAALVAVVVMIG